MNDLKNIIAKNIAELRKENSMTQFELAEKLNYTDKAVSKWERGESVPDIAVLKHISEIFGVSIDYLTEDGHESKRELKNRKNKRKKKNHGFVTGIAIVMVWLVATLVFVVIESVPLNTKLHYLAFVYAIPASLIVWLVFNSIWFSFRRNFVIISLLVWSVLIAIYLNLLLCGINLWLIFVLGIPAEAIIIMWSRIKNK